MSKNVEIKAKISDIKTFLQLASSIADGPAQILEQVDTYFKVDNGRLKLRRIQGEDAELIFYDRPDTEGPKLSNYSKQEFKNSEEVKGLLDVLTSSLGVLGEVRKTRHLLMSGQTRIHVDNVQNLGCFMELEVVLKENETLNYGKQIADELMAKLNVNQEDLISGSYLNLLTKPSN
ncbi:uncharacterized protein [Parasteatoda tepidariorum]|uniref:CYTH domain-containing protein n=1 Tax=Parasteatoda tepidariorum TaxID=114398 RepID=A0A2L2Y6J5_PARTP|nr:uncharacterized protein LOC107439012 [Parasteatoda tepidariorum]